MKMVFAQSAFRQFRKLERNNQKRIIEKLHFYISQPNPIKFAEPLSNAKFGNWRFRIGEHRVLFDVEKNKIIVLKIGHRKDVYR